MLKKAEMPMLVVTASDEVTDAIAYIEMLRQEQAKDSGLAVSCAESLRKLQELLAQERAASVAPAADQINTANVEAVTLEIQRIQRLASNKSHAGAGNARRGHQQHAPDRNGPRKQGRNKGRRQQGRRGER